MTGRAGSEQKRATTIVYVFALILVVAYPVVVRSAFFVNVGAEILIFAIVAMSLDLLLGYTGLASFGHAAFFGIGAYTAGLIATGYTSTLPASLLPAVVAAGLAAFAGGWLAIRASGIYFIFLTLALGQTVFAVAFKWKVLSGGSDGLAGIPRPSLGPALDSVIDLNDPVVFYWLVAAFFVASFVLLCRVVASPFGQVLVGIRENPERASAIGYNVPRYKLAAFVVSGGFAGLGGALYAYFNRLVAPDQVAWQTSAMLLVMVVLGGAGTLVGPAIGAGVVLLLQNVVSSYTERWPMIMAAIFIVCVLVARQGIWGVCRRVRS